jgi:microcystin-dependent protein
MPNNPARRRVGVKVASFGRASKGYVGTQVSVLEQRIQQQATNSSPQTVEQSPIPAGVTMGWPAAIASIPTGWLLCDGSVLNIEDYPTLGALLGSTYGGDGVTTFGLPDSRDRFTLAPAAGEEPGATGGSTQHKHAVGTLAAANQSAGTPAGAIDAHTTTAVQSGAGTNVFTGPATHTFTGTPLAAHTHTLSGKTADAENGAGSTASEDIYPPFLKEAKIIKT